MDVTKYSGESVLLPCSCTDLQAQGRKWFKDSVQGYVRIDLTKPADRIQVTNQDFPGNFSLLISDLTKEDEGWYRCHGKINNYRYFTLTVTGRTLLTRTFQTLYIIYHFTETDAVRMTNDFLKLQKYNSWDHRFFIIHVKEMQEIVCIMLYEKICKMHVCCIYMFRFIYVYNVRNYTWKGLDSYEANKHVKVILLISRSY